MAELKKADELKSKANIKKGKAAGYSYYVDDLLPLLDAEADKGKYSYTLLFSDIDRKVVSIKYLQIKLLEDGFQVSQDAEYISIGWKLI